MTPYIALGGAAAVLAALIASYVAGRNDGRALERGEQDRAAAAVEASVLKSREALVEAISQIEVKNVYTTQRLEKETVEKPVYRDCVHSDDAFRLLNDALTPPERRQDLGETGVSRASPAERSELWGDGTEIEAGR